MSQSTVQENVSYVTTTSSQFTTEREVGATDQLEVNTNPSYSSIGQVYEDIVSDSNARRQQQEAGISTDETQGNTFSESHDNVSYVTTRSSQFTTGQEVGATDQLEVNTNQSYSSIGQVYEVIVSDSNAGRQQQEEGNGRCIFSDGQSGI